MTFYLAISKGFGLYVEQENMTEVQKAFSYHFIFQKSMLRLHRKTKHGRIGEGLLISLYFPEINTDTSSLF